ncbi:MAG: hypothetical protein R2880_20035 [Deinococcales bacterium]
MRRLEHPFDRLFHAGHFILGILLALSFGVVAWRRLFWGGGDYWLWG